MTSNIKIIKINSEISSIILKEPKTYNSLSFKNLIDLLKALKKLDADNKVKVIILEGAGKGFSAGHNLKEVRGLKKRDKYQKLFNLCSKVMLQIVEGRKPVIAKVHGAAFAKALAFSLNIPTIPIHHMEAHLIMAKYEADSLLYPFMTLLVSGGHTLLAKVNSPDKYKILGESIDDAVGEAFDKTAKLLGFKYPGGPEI